jgi:hypothetical protein
LSLVHAFGHDLIDRALDERRRDRLTPSTPGSIMHHHAFVAFEVTEKFADVSLKTVDAPDFAQVLALGPAMQARKFTPAPNPPAVPQTPYWLRVLFRGGGGVLKDRCTTRKCGVVARR